MYDRRHRTAACDFIYVKSQSQVTFVVQKYLLQYLLKCANAKICIFLHGDSNVIMFREIPWELTENIFFQEICALWKWMLGINKRPFFSLKNIFLYNLWYLTVLKTLNTHGEVILTLSFSKNIIFMEKLLF